MKTCDFFLKLRFRISPEITNFTFHHVHFIRFASRIFLQLYPATAIAIFLQKIYLHLFILVCNWSKNLIKIMTSVPFSNQAMILAKYGYEYQASFFTLACSFFCFVFCKTGKKTWLYNKISKVYRVTQAKIKRYLVSHGLWYQSNVVSSKVSCLEQNL